MPLTKKGKEASTEEGNNPAYQLSMRAACDGEAMEEDTGEQQQQLQQQQQQQQQQSSVFGQMTSPALAGQCAFVFPVRLYARLTATASNNYLRLP